MVHELTIPGSGDPPPRPIEKLFAAANKEHRKANESAADALQHALRAGEILAKARDMCKAGPWGDYLAVSFEGSMRTAQKYMRLARHWKLIQSKGPVAAITSQTEAAKALTSIIRGDVHATQKGGTKRTRRARGACDQNAATMVRAAIALLRRVESELAAWGPPVFPLMRAGSLVRTRYTELERVLDSLGVAATTGAPSPPPTEPSTEGEGNASS